MTSVLRNDVGQTALHGRITSRINPSVQVGGVQLSQEARFSLRTSNPVPEKLLGGLGQHTEGSFLSVVTKNGTKTAHRVYTANCSTIPVASFNVNLQITGSNHYT